MIKGKYEIAKKVFQDYGPVVKTSILKKTKFHSREIAGLVSDGHIKKLKTGYYIWVDYEDNISDFALACGQIPMGVIYLYSAAAYYELTTFNPAVVSIAVPSNNRNIKTPENPPVEIYPIYRGFELGITEVYDKGLVRIYDIERTVCDFFKNRNKVGIDITLEIIKNYMAQKDKNIQKLMEYAEKITDKEALASYVEVLL